MGGRERAIFSGDPAFTGIFLLLVLIFIAVLSAPEPGPLLVSAEPVLLESER